MSYTSSVANIHSHLVTQLTQRVSDNIAVLIKDMETQKKQVCYFIKFILILIFFSKHQLEKDTANMNSEFNKMAEACKKTRDEFFKATKEAEVSFLTLEKAKTENKEKEIKKFEKDLEKKRQIATKEEEDYRQQIVAGNTFIDKYYDELMPTILSVSDFKNAISYSFSILGI